MLEMDKCLEEQGKVKGNADRGCSGKYSGQGTPCCR